MSIVPRRAALNSPNRFVCNVRENGDRIHVYSACQSSANGFDLFPGQKVRRAFFPAQASKGILPSVFHVFFVRDPFKILGTKVSLNAVDVIDVKSFYMPRNESERHETMHVDRAGIPRAPCSYNWISMLIAVAKLKLAKAVGGVFPPSRLTNHGNSFRTNSARASNFESRITRHFKPFIHGSLLYIESTVYQWYHSKP